MRDHHLKKAGVLNHFTQASLFSSIFVFTSNIRGIRLILEQSLHAILFPLAIAPDGIASILAFLSFANAKNKNLGKTFDLFYLPIKTALVFTAVFAGLSALAVHGLFLAAIGSGFIYHTSLCFYNAYRWLKTGKLFPADLKRKDIYKNNIINNSMASLTGGIVISGILLTMVFAPYIGASILAVAGIGTAVMLMLTTTYATYKHLKNSTATPSPYPSTEPAPLYRNWYSQQNNSNAKGYYHRECRSEQLTGNMIEDNKFLAEEINNKIKKLNTQIEQHKGTLLEYLWSENPKREAKKQFLFNIKSKLHQAIIKRSSPPSTTQTQSIHSFTSPPKRAFQSFFRAIGDVEDLAEAAEKHLAALVLKSENNLLENSGSYSYSQNSVR